ncbi:S-adenosylmethionine-dependent methyltransferase [Acrasis kona]|uniref:S-adenosylmethionine-dependent methyltransferase n=1 Tax=Acrasis kona TaxID=1008807 RepID=A0AAW2Z2U5_9EUKA
MNKVEFTPIGYIETCFKQKTGCPRQSLIVPKARGILKITYEKDVQNLNTIQLVEGLEGFSHIWLFWVFHQNNADARIKTKVKPPRMDGEKIGALACRSPYRPNPLGMSIVKLDKIVEDKECTGRAVLHLSGVDLVDQTPVIDIKPYIPMYDIITENHIPGGPTVSNWMANMPRQQISIPHVSFSIDAELQLKNLVDAKKLQFYDNIDDAKEVIRDIISLDPRSKYRREKCNKELLGFGFDIMNLRCKIEGEHALVVEVEDWSKGMPYSKEELKQRARSERFENLNPVDYGKDGEEPDVKRQKLE